MQIIAEKQKLILYLEVFYMKKFFSKKRVLILVALCLLALASVFCWSVVAEDDPNTGGLPFTPKQMEILMQVKRTLGAYQVDADKKETYNDEKLYYGAMKGLVSSLKDPYTRFVEPKDLEEENMEMQGEYGGLGIYIGQRDEKILVIAPMEGTPADRAGLKPLDEIVKVDKKSTHGMKLDQVVKMLRGKAGVPVDITIRRKNKNTFQLIDVHLVREMIKIKTVRFEMIGKLGYIKINQFNQKTNEDVEAAIKQLMTKKAQGFIMDLRNNPGGLLDACVKVTSQFVDTGLVVSMKGRFPGANEELYAIPGRANKLPLVVLINEGSASASEIFSGAIKDHKRGTIIGKKSFGKGSVQTLFNLPDKSGIYITIARYFTPSGYMMDKKGLNPDIVVDGEINRDKKKDKQLQKAIAVLTQKIGGKASVQKPTKTTPNKPTKTKKK